MYALLDGARDEQIYAGLMRSGREDERCCLYRGTLDPALAQVAPYLVRLHPLAPLTDWLLVRGWGASWGIFVESSASLRELQRHFRRFLMVYDEDGKPLYFRYYDPRVLRTYLPICQSDELAIVFGPVTHYLMEGESPSLLVEYTLTQGQCDERIISLIEP